MNFSLSSKPRCNLRHPSSPMVSPKHVPHMPMDNFRSLFWRPYAFILSLFHCIPLSYESFIPK